LSISFSVMRSSSWLALTSAEESNSSLAVTASSRLGLISEEEKWGHSKEQRTTRGTGHPKCTQDDNEVHNQGLQSNLHRTRLRPSKSKGSNKALHRNNSETKR
jgi:hypothetical protein